MPGAGTYALWNGVAAAKAGAITAATVSASVTIAQPFDTVFTSGHTSTTGGVVATNTGNVGTTFSSSVGLAAGTSPALAAVIPVSVWPVASVTACTTAATVPAGAVTGTLAMLALAAPTTGFLVAGASYAFCVRESMDVTSAPGIASGSVVNPVFTATVTAGTVWSSTAAAGLAQTFVDDIAPSAPTGLTGRSGSTSSVALSWTAATDNVGVVAYDVYRSGTSAPIGSTAATSFTDAGAAASTSYTYSVVARDAVGLTSPAATALADRTAPGTPTLTLTGTTGSTATLSFSAADNVGVSAYTVSRDGTAIATVGGATTTYTDTGLTVGVHRYTVTASDAAGNVSAPSAPVSAAGSYASGSWYQLVNAASGRCVTVPSPIANGGVLTQSACAGPASGAQEWLLTTSSGTTATVTSALPSLVTGQYLWAGARTAPVAVTSSRTATNGSTLWTFTVQADGSFTIANTITGDNGNGNGNGFGNTTTLCATGAAAGGGQLTTTTCTAGVSTQSFFLRQVTP
ncbi:fibronectin type III domain-containing protein [Streptomyces sp. L7]|uniref:fibronectin type III domain-containing protein n=1 Tax=Streptomyces sp. L7 TaxID=3423954 RepID=UPI003D99E226